MKKYFFKISLCVLIISVAMTSKIYSYDMRKFTDGQLWNDPDFEYDWGSCFTITDSFNRKLLEGRNFYYGSDATNAVNSNGLRFTHWCAQTPNIKGWQGTGDYHWVTENEKNTNNKLSIWDSYWDLGINNPNFPDTVFKRTGVLDAAIYNKDNNYQPWGYSNGNPLWWGRWGIIYYKRRKPIPNAGICSVSTTNGNTYEDKENLKLWMQPGIKEYVASAVDSYEEGYGNEAQSEAGIRKMNVKIGGSTKYSVTVDRNNNQVLEDGFNAKYIETTDYEQRQGFGSTRYGTQTKVIFNAVDGANYLLAYNAANKWLRWITDDDNWLSGNESLTLDGDKVVAGFKNDNMDINSKSFKYLYIDGQAPTYDSKLEDNDSQVILTLNNIEDHSGIKNNEEGVGFDYLDITMYPSDYPKLKVQKKVDNTSITNNNAKIILDYNEEQKEKYGEYTVEIRAVDLLGNTSIRKLTFYRINLKAEIIRVLEPHEPIFRIGEQGNLNIEVQGKVEKVIIEFPKELSTLDGTLNQTIELKPSEKEEINKKFFIPQGAEEKDYTVKVIAIKGDKVKYSYPRLTVKGNILNQLRTRLINK